MHAACGRVRGDFPARKLLSHFGSDAHYLAASVAVFSDAPDC
jgi:hypothetical protein